MSLPTPAGSLTPTACEVAISSLRQLLGDRLSTATTIRKRHGKDVSYHPSMPPDAVAFPRTTSKVSDADEPDPAGLRGRF
jgi:hypothetical protein